MSENLRTHVRALFGFDATVRRARPDSWANPSPCEGWTAADVVAHNVGMNQMIEGFASGIGARSAEHPEIAEPVDAWKTSFEALQIALDRRGALHVVSQTPWGEMPVDAFLGFAWVDPLLHTWDLARATGQVPVLDMDLVTRGASQLERAGDSLVGPGRFHPPVALGDEPAVIERFLAASGRDPRS